VFPSAYEGFGFPLVEAFAHGLPAIASDIPALRELDNGAARFVPAHDVEAWARAVAELAADEEGRRRMRARGLERAAEVSYRETARGRAPQAARRARRAPGAQRRGPLEPSEEHT